MPAADESPQIIRPSTKPPASDRYLSIVLPKSTSSPEDHTHAPEIASEPSSTEPSEKIRPTPSLCEICNLPMANIDDTLTGTNSKPHESSLVHQVCLSHSHPPSHLDRTRHGLKYLSCYGWDPDSRLGLGAAGEGIRVPIKGKIKNNVLGIGINLISREGTGRKQTVQVPAQPQKLDARRVRRKAVEDRKHQEKLQDLFYRDGDWEKYLGI